MATTKFLLPLLVCAVLSGLIMSPALAANYTVGVSAGQYVTYGNFASSGPGVEAFNDYAQLTLQVKVVNGKEVTLLSTGTFKNGTAIPGNGTVTIWNVETGTENGAPATQGPIISANLHDGDAIPPPNTYMVNQTVPRSYLGVSRSVNVLDVELSTPDYTSLLDYVYDQSSGMLLEATSQTTVQGDSGPITSQYQYSIVGTNIFGSTATPTPSPSSDLPTIYLVVVIAVIVVVLATVLWLKRKSL